MAGKHRKTPEPVPEKKQPGEKRVTVSRETIKKILGRNKDSDKK